MRHELDSNLFKFSDLPLTQLSHTFAECSIWLAEGMADRMATFDLVVRDMPVNRNYLVAAGLEEIVNYLMQLKFNRDQIKFLSDDKLITPEFAKYLKTHKFSGDVYAMLEGTVFFPGEPMVRVTAPIIEATLIEVFMFNVASSNVGFMSKAARYKTLADQIFISIGMMRPHSFESGIKASRSGYIAGLKPDSFPIFSKKFNIQPTKYIINGQHLFIKSFKDELTAFEKINEYFPDNASFMIDTYNFSTGLKNAIKVGLAMKQRGQQLRFVTIDAGDLHQLTCRARQELDQNGLEKVGILVASNLDEYKIKKLIEQNTPADYYVTATEYNTLADSPKLEVVYKLAELRQGKNIQYCAKLTPGKESYPARKQVFRKFKKGKMIGDVIGLDNEKLGTPLLKPIIKKGKLVYKLPKLNQIRSYTDKQLKQLPIKLLDIEKQHSYPVKISSKLTKLFEGVKKQHG